MGLVSFIEIDTEKEGMCFFLSAEREGFENGCLQMHLLVCLQQALYLEKDDMCR